MSHPEEGMIHAWLDGALSGDESAVVASHVDACAECQRVVVEARGLISASSRIVAALDGGVGATATRAPAVAPAVPASVRAIGTVRRWRMPAALAATVLIAAMSVYVARRSDSTIATMPAPAEVASHDTKQMAEIAPAPPSSGTAAMVPPAMKAAPAAAPMAKVAVQPASPSVAPQVVAGRVAGADARASSSAVVPVPAPMPLAVAPPPPASTSGAGASANAAAVAAREATADVAAEKVAMSRVPERRAAAMQDADAKVRAEALSAPATSAQKSARAVASCVKLLFGAWSVGKAIVADSLIVPPSANWTRPTLDSLELHGELPAGLHVVVAAMGMQGTATWSDRRAAVTVAPRCP